MLLLLYNLKFSSLFQGDRPTKIEKADILELTVSHLQKMKVQSSTQHTAEERLGFPSGIDESAHMFKAGFSECSRLIDNMLHTIVEKNTQVGIQQRLRQHLKNCLASLPQVSNPYLERSSSSNSDSSSTSSSSLILLSPVSHVESSSLLSPVSLTEHSPTFYSESHYSCQSSPENFNNMRNCENTIPSSTIHSSPVSSASNRLPLSFNKNMFINTKTNCLNDPKMWRPW